jgi:hypothetical protein
MKTLAALLLFAAPMLAQAMDIHPGDSFADVQAILGAPSGQAQIDQTVTVFYACGLVQVQFVDGKVTHSNLLSPESFAVPPAQAKVDDVQTAQLRAQHVAEGEALKAKTLADPDFMSMSAGTRLIFWADFRTRYPDVSCDDEYNLALANWQADQLQIAGQQITRPGGSGHHRLDNDYHQQMRRY